MSQTNAIVDNKEIDTLSEIAQSVSNRSKDPAMFAAIQTWAVNTLLAHGPQSSTAAIADAARWQQMFSLQAYVVAREIPQVPSSEVIPLILKYDSGRPVNISVQAKQGGRDVLLGFDTGSSASFTFRKGKFDVGGKSWALGTRRLPELNPEPLFGRHVIGLFGADYVLSGTTELDLRNAYVKRTPPGSLPSGVSAWPSIPFENIQGHIIVTVTINAKQKRLMLDTGAPHTTLIGEGGKPGDEEGLISDVTGAIHPVFTRTENVTVTAGVDGRVEVMRAPRFPMLEGMFKSFGGNLDGLLGFSVLGRRRVVFDSKNKRIHFEPISNVA